MTGLLRDLALGAGLPLYCVRKRVKTGAWPRGWTARNGAVDAPKPRAPGARILVHGVSVGETHAIAPFVEALDSSPARPDVVVSASTDTGFARAQELYGGQRGGSRRSQRGVVRFPLDFTWTTERFLGAVRPSLVVLAELELWPSFLAACARRRIPVCVVNGRLSERSFRGYRRWRFLARRLFRGLRLVVAQTEKYGERFVEVGVPSERVVVAGSFKWDAAQRAPNAEAAEKLRKSLGIDPDQPLVVAGSTGPGEEESLLRALPNGCQLLLAPRDPSRWDEVAAMRPGMTRRSRSRDRGVSNPQPGGQVFLLDTLGELSDAYLLADAVFVGRSLVPMGGSNPLEPLALGKPTVIGPHWDNFEGIVEELLRAGGIAVSDRPMEVIQRWLAEPEARRAAAEGARKAFAENRGSSARASELVLGLLH